MSSDKHHRELKALLCRLVLKWDFKERRWRNIADVGHPANCEGGIGIDRAVLKARAQGYLTISREPMPYQLQTHVRRTFLKITDKGLQLVKPQLAAKGAAVAQLRLRMKPNGAMPSDALRII